MPLRPGSSNEVIEQNAHEMMAAGHPEDQAWAAAYRNAGRSRRRVKAKIKKGGGKRVKARVQHKKPSKKPCKGGKR